MTVTCEIIESIQENLLAFGLAFYIGGRQICMIEDMTFDREQIEALCHTINTGRVDDIHILD
ncbi:MAG: hypothetical protein IJC15_03375, partial [Clostridia bacterium]|nr:hypothetical protein [Clostridia bacterium]